MARRGRRAGAAGMLAAASLAGVVPAVCAQEMHAGHAAFGRRRPADHVDGEHPRRGRQLPRLYSVRPPMIV